MPQTKPNVILITIDALRAEHLGSFGYSRPTSPFLDDWIKGSLNFRAHFSNSSQSPPGFFSIFSSAYPLARKDWSTTAGPYLFLPELFRSGGYETVGFASAPYISPFFGYDRGYDDLIYTGIMDEEDPAKKIVNRILPGSVVPNFKKWVKETRMGKALNRVRYFFLPQHAYASAAEINAGLDDYLSKRKSKKPLFLWIHYMDAHNPFLSSREDLRAIGYSLSQMRVNWLNRKHLQLTRFDPFEDVLHMSMKELKDLEACYDAKILYLDRHLKNIFEFMKKVDISDDNSIFAITSDHGEAFGEHHGIGHTERLYDELLHVPFFLRGQGVKPQAVTELTEHVDIVPTLVKLAGVKLPKGQAEGVDMLSIAAGRTKHSQIFAEVAPNVGGMLSNIDFERSVFAVRTKEWKFIRDFAREREELYNLTRDPEESKNLADEEIKIKNLLARELSEHMAKIKVLI